MRGYGGRLTERKWIPIHCSAVYFSPLYQQTAAWHVAQLFLCVIHTQPTESDRMEPNSEGSHVLDTETHHNVDLYCRCCSSNVPRRNLIPSSLYTEVQKICYL